MGLWERTTALQGTRDFDRLSRCDSVLDYGSVYSSWPPSLWLFLFRWWRTVVWRRLEVWWWQVAGWMSHLNQAKTISSGASQEMESYATISNPTLCWRSKVSTLYMWIKEKTMKQKGWSGTINRETFTCTWGVCVSVSHKTAPSTDELIIAYWWHILMAHHTCVVFLLATVLDLLGQSLCRPTYIPQHPVRGKDVSESVLQMKG